MTYRCVTKCFKKGRIYEPGDLYETVPGEKFSNRNFEQVKQDPPKEQPKKPAAKGKS